MTENENPLADEAVDTLHGLMKDSESDSDKIRAAKILLDRAAPKEDDEAKKHEAEERDAAFTEAYGLLTELARYKYAFHRLQNALAEASKAPAADPARQLADLADFGWARLGEDENGG
jgi:hypothetical protein